MRWSSRLLQRHNNEHGNWGVTVCAALYSFVSLLWTLVLL